MISHGYRCIYIHIPKTAGTSIEYRLGLFKELKRGVQDHSTIRDVEPLSAWENALLLLRGDAGSLYRRLRYSIRSRGALTRQQFESYFKFTFVRNSWSRVFSWYQNVMRDPVHRHSLGIPDLCTFEEFVQRHLGQRMLRSQLFWITDFKGKVPLNFIGRYESLEKDFSHVGNILGLEDKSLPKLLSGGNPHYPQFYNGETRNLVAEIYAEEIDFFKFKFGE